MKKLYMHLIDGKPAVWWNYQIVYADKNIKTSQMCKSLYMCIKQQELSRKWREENGLSYTHYRYMIVYVEESKEKKEL